MNTRILLVDDEKDFLETLGQRLKIRGLSVSSSPCGRDAIKQVESKEFDVVVLDLSMPGMDGIETLKRLKKFAPETEVIMLSGHGTIQASCEAMKLGAEDFLEKPFNLDTLLEKIDSAHNKKILVLEEKSTEAIKDILKSKSW